VTGRGCTPGPRRFEFLTAGYWAAMPEHYTPLRGRVQAVTIVFVILALVCAGAVWSGYLESS
jgi:hypothetical protein